MRQLRSRRLRVLLTATGIVLGVGMISGVLLLSATIQRTFTDLFDSVYGKTDLVVSGSQSTGSLPLDSLERARRVEGVGDASANVFSTLTLIDDQGEAREGNGATINVAGLDPGGPDFSDAKTVEGRDVAAPSRAQVGEEIVLDRSFADTNGLEVGDRVRLAAPSGVIEPKLVGLQEFAGGLEFGGQGFGAMPLGFARRAFDKPDVWDEVDIVVDGGQPRIEQARRALRAEFGKGLEIETPQGKGQEIEDQLQAFNVVLYFFAGMALFVGGFLIFNSFNMTVLQRMREIGMQRTLGATGGMIVRSVLIEALLLGVVGAAIGLGLGVLLALGLIELMKGFGFPIGELRFTATAPIAAVGTGVLTSCLGALTPARRAGRIAPIRAILGTEGIRDRPRLSRALLGVALIVPGLAGAFQLGAADETTTLVVAAGIAGTIATFFGIALLAPFLIAPLTRLLSWPIRRLSPVEGRIAADSARSNPIRTAATATALMIGLALVVAVNTLGASFLHTISKELDKSFARDLTVQPRGFAPGSGPQQTIAEGLTAKLAKLPDAKVVTPERLLFVSHLPPKKGSEVRPQGLVLAFDPAVYDEVDSTEIDAGGAPMAEAFDRIAAGGVTVGRGYADEAGIEVGDAMKLEGPSGTREAKVAGIVDTVFAGGQTVGMSLPTMRRVFGVTADSQIALKATSDDARAPLQRSVEKLLKRDYPNLTALSNDELKSDIESQVSQQFGFFNAIVGVAIFVSLFGIINTLSMSVIERTREIGVLRALGTTRWQVRRTVGDESLIIALIGAVMGIAIGAGLGFALLKGLSFGIPGVSYRAPLGTMLGVAVAAVVLGILAALLPARRAARLDVVEALSYE
ncbi:MAG: ABC transporter permease [Solirubrobacterales bacterium]